MAEDEDVRAGSLGHYARIVRRRRLTVLLVLAAALVAAAVVSDSQQSVYEAQSKIVVGQGNTLFQVQNGNSIQPFTATMADLITSNVVAQRVASSLGLRESPATLLSRVSVSINPQTAVMTVSVTDDSARRAQQINAAFGGVFALLVQERLGQITGRPGNHQPPISASVFDPAHILPGRVSPAPARNLLIAAILGLLLGLAAAFVRDHLDPRLRSDEELEAAFRAPVIGRVPAHTRSRRGVAGAVRRLRAIFEAWARGDWQLPWKVSPGSADDEKADGVWDDRRDAVEAYRVMRATLRSQATERPLRKLLVSSVTPGCGKEAVAANLARTFARAGARTVLVEADLERRLLDQTIAHAGIGLAALLAGLGELTQAIESGVVDFLPGGPVPANTSDLLASARMAELIDQAASGCEYVLLDAPPLLGSGAALELARAVDAVVLVARCDETRGDQAADVRALLDRVDVHLAGLVITEAGVGPRARRREPEEVPARGEAVAVRVAAGRFSDR